MQQDGIRPGSKREPVRKAALLTFFLFAGVVSLLLLGAGQAKAAAPVIVNSASNQWLESTSAATNGEPAGSRQVTVSLMVRHDVGQRINRIKIDEDYNGNDDTTSKGTRTLSASQWEQPTIIGGYGYTRVTYTFDAPKGGDLSCPFVGSGTPSENRPLRIRALDQSGQESATASSTIRFVRYDCNAREDHPALFQRGQDKTSITPGETVNFTFTADDSDGGITANRDFGGLNYRFRRLGDGNTTGGTTRCYGNSDNTQRSLAHTFSRRGRWVLEAELLNNNDCNHNPNPGGWWRIGSVDVNSPASASPTISLGASVPGSPARPQIGQSFTVTATVGDTDETGVAQDIEWDLDGNNTYDDASLGDWKTGLTSGQRQRTINTASLAPGLYTVRARTGDNGALGGADDIRRTKVATTQYRVDTPPVALPGSEQTVTGAPVDIALAGTDADGDSLAYSVTTQPSHGEVTGSGAIRTYTPDPGYAGMDSFEFEADDGYGGTSTATVDVRVDPDLDPFAGPNGEVDSRGGQVEFSSHATGASFECQFDGGPWTSCASPFGVSDLPDGPHTLRTRVTANGLTNPVVGEANWTVNAFPKVGIDNQPDTLTDQTSAAVDFTLSEDGATVTPTSECKLDQLDWVPCETGVSWDDLDDGEHTIRIQATDAFGKQSVQGVTWTVLTDGGSTAIESPYPASYTRETSAEINFSGSANTEHTECSLDGDAWQACVSPTTVSGLAEGEHTLRVRSVNALGKPSPQPARITWTVDRTPPVAKILTGPRGDTPNGPAAFTFNANENFSTFECKLDAGDYVPCSSPFDLPEGIADGYHSFRVAAIDRAGNRSLAPQRDFRLLSAAPAPEITSGPAEGATTRATAASFGISAVAAVPAFECKVDDGDYAPCTNPVSVTGLSDGSHTFSVLAIDEVGNRSAEPATRSWTVDTTAPGTGITNGPAGESSSADAEFRFESSEPGSSFECSLDGAGWQACSSPNVITGLADGPHEFRVRATDAAGNTGSSPASRAWTVDTTAAVPDPPLPDPETQPCDFRMERDRCGDPFMVASAKASFRKKRGRGSISFEVDSGKVELTRLAARVPSGVVTTAFSGKAGRKVGSVTLSGTTRTTVALKLPKRVKSRNIVAGATSGPKVLLKPRSVVLTNLPPGTTGAKIKLKSSRGLGIGAWVCGTRSWRTLMTDTGSATRPVGSKGDVKCVRRATR